MTEQLTPLVSVAIPVYNGANYMRAAIDSVLGQTYEHIDVIVVNDGSSDNGETENIAMSYGSRIQYFAKKNGGVASALNLALQEAKGQYFCWLSHDDVYLPEKVGRQVAFLQSLPDKNAVVFSRHSLMDRHGNHLRDLPPPPSFPPNQAAFQLILQQWLHCCTILAPTDVYRQFGGFREDLPTTQDYDLLVRMALNHPFFELPEVLLRARSHSEQGSLTLGHRNEVEQFFNEHIPMLTPDYMKSCFESRDSVQAFLALGRQMAARGYIHALALAGLQLIRCEADRAPPDFLWESVTELTRLSQPPTVAIRHDHMKTFARRWIPPSLWNALKNLKLRLETRGHSSIPAGTVGSTAQRTVRLDFDRIFEENGFAGTESRSGEGSTLFQTRIVREELPRLFGELGVDVVLDVPCGDWNWMRHVNLGNVSYIGGDIVQAIVDRNNRLFGSEKVAFSRLNIVTGPLPRADLVLCRDCLVHLSFSDALSALDQFKKSGAKWLLTTTFTDRSRNDDLYEGHVWRPLNLQKAPFNLGQPEYIINEGCTEGHNQFQDKCLALWTLQTSSE